MDPERTIIFSYGLQKYGKLQCIKYIETTFKFNFEARKKRL